MQDKFDLRLLIIGALLIGLFILTFIILKPVAISIVFGLLLAYIFYPVYKKVLKKLKNENLSALTVCIGLLVLIGIAISITVGVLVRQAINFYLSLQQFDFSSALSDLVPDFLASSELYSSFSGSLNNFISNIIADLLKNFSNWVLNMPQILLQLFIVLFAFFFLLRDGDKIIKYVKSLSPLNKETENKFFKQFKDVTHSVLIGQIIVGAIQGIVAGIGYFIFGAPGAIILTLLTMLASIIPLIGAWLIWVPADIYLFISGETGAAIGLLLYSLIIVSLVDNIVRPIFVSRKTQVNPAIVVVGMIGGLFAFGVLGLIIGPLILAYVLLVIELYRKKIDKQHENIIFKEID